MSSGGTDGGSTVSGTGTVEADADGKYTAPYIGGSTYNQNYSFTLEDPTHKNWYSDSRYDGSGLLSDVRVTMSCASTATPGGTVTVTATLNKAQNGPVSFDWKAGGGIGVTETTSGTVTWNAGDTADKTFTVTVDAKGDLLWDGKQGFVISASNITNAKFADNGATVENEKKSDTYAWSKIVTLSADDRDAIVSNYDFVNSGATLTAVSTDFSLAGSSNVAAKKAQDSSDNSKPLGNYNYYRSSITGFPSRFPLELVFSGENDSSTNSYVMLVNSNTYMFYPNPTNPKPRSTSKTNFYVGGNYYLGTYTL